MYARNITYSFKETINVINLHNLDKNIIEEIGKFPNQII